MAWHSPGPVVAPGVVPSAGTTTGKPMPAAGETAHVRRLLVDRSRCGLEVSPASPEDTESSGPGRRVVVARSGREPLSRRMWGRRPGRPGECRRWIERKGAYPSGHRVQGQAHQRAGSIQAARDGEAGQAREAG